MTKDFLFRTASVFMLVGTLSSSIPVLATGPTDSPETVILMAEAPSNNTAVSATKFTDSSDAQPQNAGRNSSTNNDINPSNCLSQAKQKVWKLKEDYKEWASKHPLLASTATYFAGTVVTLGIFAILYYQGSLNPECLQGVITNQTSDPSTTLSTLDSSTAPSAFYSSTTPPEYYTFDLDEFYSELEPGVTNSEHSKFLYPFAKEFFSQVCPKFKELGDTLKLSDSEREMKLLCDQHPLTDNGCTPMFEVFKNFPESSDPSMPWEADPSYTRNYCAGGYNEIARNMDLMVELASECFPDFGSEVIYPKNPTDLKALCRRMLGYFIRFFPQYT